MGAIRVIDDHVELANIGTNTHTQIDSHIADPSAHHAKYTNSEAVAAVLAADDYVKNIGDNMTGVLTIHPPAANAELHIDGSGATQGVLKLTGSNSEFRILGYSNQNAYIQAGYTSHNDGNLYFSGLSLYTGQTVYFKFATADFLNGIIKDPKNHAASALSGTKKLVEIKIGAQSYYFEVYPTKA